MTTGGAGNTCGCSRQSSELVDTGVGIPQSGIQGEVGEPNVDEGTAIRNDGVRIDLLRPAVEPRVGVGCAITQGNADQHTVVRTGVHPDKHRVVVPIVGGGGKVIRKIVVLIAGPETEREVIPIAGRPGGAVIQEEASRERHRCGLAAKSEATRGGCAAVD